MTFFKTLRDCFLFQRSSAEIPHSRKIIYQVYHWGMVVLMGVVLGILALLLACCNRGYEVFYGYFRSPMILLLNLLPPVFLMVGLYAATGRAWIAWLVTSFLMLVFPVANLYVVSFRDDPVTIAEVLLAREGLTIAANYTIELEARVWAAIIAIPAGTVLLFFAVRGRNSWKPRVIILAALLLSLVPLAFVYTSKTIYDEYTWNYEHLTEKRATERFIGKGYWYPFFYAMGELLIPEQGPSSSATVEITDTGEQTVTVQPETAESVPTETFLPGSIDEDRKVDVIMIMMEAFSDLTDLGIEGIHEDVYADWHAFEAESYHGDLVNNIFAAGTVNTERCVLTGDFWVPDEGYTADAGSYVRYLADQGYTVSGSHPIYGWFYDRRTINQYLGFQDYRFWEERYQFMVQDIAEFLYRDDLFLNDVYELYLAGTNRQHGLDEMGNEILVPYFPEKTEEQKAAELQEYLASLVETEIKQEAPAEGQESEQTPEHPTPEENGILNPATVEADGEAEAVYTEPVPLYYPYERTPYFGFHVTYQGHATYGDDYLGWGGREYYSRDVAAPEQPTAEEISGSADIMDYVEAWDQYANRPVVSDQSYYILNNYLGSVADTIQELIKLRDKLNSQDEPVVLVLFGDHKPWLGDGNSVYKELGINLDTDTEEGFYNYYTTPYLIWANDAAKEKLGNDFVGEGPDISPAYLMNELFALCGWDGPAYMDLMEALRSTLPVVNTDGYYVTADGFTDELTEEQQRALNNVRQMADYRRTHVGDIKIVTEELP